MLQSLTRIWIVALALVSVLIVTLIQPAEAEASTSSTVLDLGPLEAPAPTLPEPQEPVGEFESPRFWWRV